MLTGWTTVGARTRTSYPNTKKIEDERYTDKYHFFRVQHPNEQVVPLSAVGRGIPSAATPTVVAREGAVAAQSVATGPALVQGMAGVVYEQQTVTATNTDGNFLLRLTPDGDTSASIPANIAGGNVATDEEFKTAMESIVGEVRKRCSRLSSLFGKYGCLISL